MYNMSDDLLSEAIAIIGMSCRFPGAKNSSDFWKNLCQGVDSLVELTTDELLGAGVSSDLIHHARYVRRAAILNDVDLFDAEFFGYSEHEATLIDPQQRVFLEEVLYCFEDAGYDPYSPGGKVGVYAGSAFNTYFYHYFENLQEPFAHPSQFAMLLHANAMDYLSTRVAYKYGFTGPAINVQTACSTSLAAVHEACMSLQSFQCDLSIAGGVSILLPQKRGYLYEPGSLLSKDGYCRTFDKHATGTVFGSGVGVVLLKRYEDALRDNDKIYALVRGSAVNNDGNRKVGFSSPSIQGQSEVIAEALNFSGVHSKQISYIEAHGTGTEMGDTIEIAALSNIFNFSQSDPCIIGSVKTNLGHLLAASGIASFIKVALMTYHKEVVPHLHFNSPPDGIDLLKSNFKVNTEHRPWDDKYGKYFSGVSSFGIGGTNVHVILSAHQQDGKNEPFIEKTLYSSVSHDRVTNLPRYTLNKKRYWHTKPGVATITCNQEIAVNENPLPVAEFSQAALCTILEKLLGITNINPFDNFFELGGHSLMFAQLITILEEEYNIQIEMHNIYEHSTISALVVYIQRKLYGNL